MWTLEVQIILGNRLTNMPNKIFRDRLVNNIDYAIRESKNASEVAHHGLVGRIRELISSKLLMPMLPRGFEIGTGKIVDHQGNQSAETDLVIYNRAVLPPILYSDRDGIFPVESSYYALEVKSRLTATEVQDAIKKGRAITALKRQSQQPSDFPNRIDTVLVLFAFSSDLAEGSSELHRYAQYDEGWLRDPVIKAICVVGRGYWYHKAEANCWVATATSPEHDEVIELISGIGNTLLRNPADRRLAMLGNYLMRERPAEFITK